MPAQDIRQLARDLAAAGQAVCYGRMGVSTQASVRCATGWCN
jgi:anaerobic selenocysteine-containing dehydrogenase